MKQRAKMAKGTKHRRIGQVQTVYKALKKAYEDARTELDKQHAEKMKSQPKVRERESRGRERESRIEIEGNP